MIGLIMIYILIDTPLEQALVGIAVVASFVSSGRAIQRSRRASLRRAEARLRKEEAEAAHRAAILAKKRHCAEHRKKPQENIYKRWKPENVFAHSADTAGQAGKAAPHLLTNKSVSDLHVHHFLIRRHQFVAHLHPFPEGNAGCSQRHHHLMQILAGITRHHLFCHLCG